MSLINTPNKVDVQLKKFVKSLDNTSSYILDNKDPKLITFILDEINKCTYFRTPSIAKTYITTVLGIKYKDIEGKLSKSTSIRTGYIIRELVKLGIVIKYGKSKRSVWKNLYKGKLHKTLDKKMEENYYLIKIKK